MMCSDLPGLKLRGNGRCPTHAALPALFLVLRGFASLSLAVLVFAVGCASPRPPRPPSLDLPQVVQDLSAERIGGQVLLRWTTSERTTDRLGIKGAITAEICRVDHTAAGPGSPCVVIARRPVAAGPSHAADPLPRPLDSGSASLLAYRIQLFNAHSRTAGLSPPTFAAAGAAPPEVQQLRAEPAPDGVLLEWKREDVSAPVELDRIPVSPGGASRSDGSPASSPLPPTKPSPKPRRSATIRPSHASSSKPAPPGQTSQPNQPGEVRLMAPLSGAGQVSAAGLSPGARPDAGGTLDATAVEGETYRYTAQRVQTISLESHVLTLRSVASAPVTVAVRDVFPPAVPAGLEAVPGGLSAQPSPPASQARSLTPSPGSIDLSWTPDTDSDLAGYFVYRQIVSSTGVRTGPTVRLNAAPLPGPAYRDLTAAAGQRYAYQVTAIDRSGNESAPSTAVEEIVREP